MSRPLLLLAGLLGLSSVSEGSSHNSADTLEGYVIYAFRGGGCGLSEHDAPNGMYLHVDIREFYRWNVGCISTSGGYASYGWPATGKKSLSKYLAFQMIPEPGYAVRILAGGASFQVRSDGAGPDSVEVMLETAYQPLRSIMRTSATSEQRIVKGVENPVVIGGPTLVRVHAWRSDSLAGGTAPGAFFIDDFTMGFQVYPTSTSAAKDHEESVPQKASVSAWPNPFNPATRIGYRVERNGQTNVSVFDALGRRVAVLVDGIVGAGDHEVTWNASAQPSGVYFIRLDSDHGSAMHKLLLAR